MRVVEVAGDGQRQIQFIYERFLEYIMARMFVERECKGLSGTEPIPAQTYVRHLKHATTNAVYMGAMRNALAIDILRTHNYATVIELARDYNDDFEVMLLVNDLCNVLVRENYEEDIFALIDELLALQPEGGEPVIEGFNETLRLIESARANEATLVRHRKLNERLQPLIRLRKLAMVNTLNGLFLTDYFNAGLYRQDPYEHLWRLMEDSIREVSNDACMYAYYLSNRRYTLDHTPLKENLSESISRRMYGIIRSESLLKSFVIGKRRKRMMGFIETSIRLTTLLIIDTALSNDVDREDRITKLLNDIRSLFSYVTCNGKVVKAVMPFFKMVMRKQITFQAAYVNNAMEYQCFWQENVVPHHKENAWSREALRQILPLLGYGTASEEERATCDPALKQLPAALYKAYYSGDSFSYFVLERIMVIVGSCDWKLLRQAILRMLSAEYRQTEWFDYSQMSLMYVLYQTSIHGGLNREIIDLYTEQAEDWTRRCRGVFRARNSHKANSSGLYKRNVMSWYCVVYCTHIGDGNLLPGDESCVPLFYKLINESIRDGDKKLLAHLIDNISEIVTDSGYIRTALQLLHHIMASLDSEEKIKRMDACDADSKNGIIALIGNVLSTAKNYFPDAVDTFSNRIS